MPSFVAPMLSICVVQARTSSVRLPNKVLADLGGIPLLSVLLRRLKHARNLSHIIVATSDEPDDDGVAALSGQEGVECTRGSLTDVASRFLAIAERFGEGCLVRISGDSPFTDPSLIDGTVELFWQAMPDLVSTSRPRTTPHGLSVEIIAAKSFVGAYSQFQSEADKEHVTKYLYDHTDVYRILPFLPSPTLSLDVSLAVDNPEDLQRARAIVARLGSRTLTADCYEIVRIAESLQ